MTRDYLQLDYTSALHVDLHTPEMDALFTKANIYEKYGVWPATQHTGAPIEVPIELLAWKNRYKEVYFYEGKQIAEHGDWIIKGPCKEKYVKKPDAFQARYIPTRFEGKFRPLGWIRAMKNPFGKLIAMHFKNSNLPGDIQYCLPDGYIAAVYDINNPFELSPIRYFIFERAFIKSYRECTIHNRSCNYLSL